MVEKKAHRGRLWKVFGSEQFLSGMCEFFTLKRAGTRTILADCSGKTKRKQGQWRQEPPFKEVLEQVKRSADTECGPQTMHPNAMKHGKWEESKERYTKVEESSEWNLERKREA